jgi:hypothetical protein
MLLEVHAAFDLSVIPFTVPEAWDAWLLFIEAMAAFSEFISVSLDTNASFDQVHLAIGHAVIHARFVGQKLAELEQLEESVFDM